MKKNSTPTTTLMSQTLSTTGERSTVSSDGPKASTLAFIRQFARCCHFQGSVSASIGAIVLN